MIVMTQDDIDKALDKVLSVLSVKDLLEIPGVIDSVKRNHFSQIRYQYALTLPWIGCYADDPEKNLMSCGDCASTGTEPKGCDCNKMRLENLLVFYKGEVVTF